MIAGLGIGLIGTYRTILPTVALALSYAAIRIESGADLKSVMAETAIGGLTALIIAESTKRTIGNKL